MIKVKISNILNKKNKYSTQDKYEYIPCCYQSSQNPKPEWERIF